MTWAQASIMLAFLLVGALSVLGLVRRGMPPDEHIASPTCTRFELRPSYKVPWVRCTADGGWASFASNQPGSLKGRTITLEIRDE